MFTNPMLVSLVAQASTDEGLTFGKLVDRLPTDPASLFTIVLLFGAIALVFWSGRSRGGGREA